LSPLHELSSTGSRFGEICFSQLFGQSLNRFIVPGEESDLPVNDDFNVSLFHKKSKIRKFVQSNRTS